MTSQRLGRAVEMGIKNLGFRGFLQKKLKKNSEVENLGF